MSGDKPTKEKEKTEDTFKFTYQRLADVSLRTSATILTILFAYAFAVRATLAPDFKWFIIGVGLLLLFSILSAVSCLFGISKGELRYIRFYGMISAVLMVSATILTFLLLVAALFSTSS
jgi:hypothetical protein